MRPVLKNVIDACFNIIMSQHNHQTIDIPILKKITEIFGKFKNQFIYISRLSYV
jgi:hypothetical protein